MTVKEMQKAKKKAIKLIKQIKKEITSLDKLNEYVHRNLKGKTYTKDIFQAIKDARLERKAYLKNILEQFYFLQGQPTHMA